MRKGLFWVIPDNDGDRKLLTYTAVCDNNGVAAKGQPAYNSKKGDSFAHKNSWQLAAEKLSMKIRGKPWDYFPRGRVEIANNKATIYYNPLLSEWSGFEAVIRRDFELDDLPVRFAPDYSKHYKSGEENLL